MREHMGLYIGKRKDNGEWVEGFYINLGGKYHYILNGQLDITRGYPDLIKHSVDPDTVGECTAVPDTSGKIIFEKDIVKFEHNELTGEVVYDTRRGEFRVRYRECGSSPLGGVSWKVIGNVTDSPELLKGGEGDE